MAESQIVNPLGAFGYTDLQTKGFTIKAPFKAEAAITGPAVVALNTTGNVATATTNSNTGLNVGICMNSPAAGEVADVVVFGVAENVPNNGAISAGANVIASTTTAGRVAASATPALNECIGVAYVAATGTTGTVDVWVWGGRTAS